MSFKRAAAVLFLVSIHFAAMSADGPAFGQNVRVRGGLANARVKFANEKKGTVAFIGGSITEMNGYRPMVCDILKRRFPETAFTFIDAGVSSTCSTTGAFRLEHDVFKGGPVDLLFVEFAVNDDQDAAHTRAECVRGMEGIVRHARALNPNADVVVTHFVNEGMIKALQAGKTPLTVEAHEAVCERYGVPSIDLAREVAGRMTAGTLTWKAYGGVHPAPLGNGICAGMIDELFERTWGGAAAGELKAHAAVEPLDPLNYEKGRFVDLKEAKIVGGFAVGVPDWKAIAGGKRDRFTSIPLLTANEAGAEFTLEFEGTAVGAYVVAGPDAGIVRASVDGGAAEDVDLYHRFSKGLHYPRTVLLGHDLKPGKHTLNVKVSPDTHGTGHAVRIVALVAN